MTIKYDMSEEDKTKTMSLPVLNVATKWQRVIHEKLHVQRTIILSSPKSNMLC